MYVLRTKRSPHEIEVIDEVAQVGRHGIYV